MASPQQIRAILNVFEHFELTGYDFLHLLLLTDMFKDHQITKYFSDHVELCLEVLRFSTLTVDTTSKWVFQVAGVLAADPNSNQRRAKQMPNEKSGPSLRSTGVDVTVVLRAWS